MHIQNGTELLICPHCSERQSDIVMDYVVPGSGRWKNDECELCYGRISVRESGGGKCEISDKWMQWYE